MYFHNLRTVAVYLFSILSIGAIAKDPVIYGEDNRIETLESRNVLYQRLASATAALIPENKIRIEGRNAFILAPSISEALNICPEERFAHQPKASDCSGVLVAPDIIATAGHCYMSPSNCGSKYWVFNYLARNARQSRFSVRTRDVYSCKEIIDMQLTEAGRNSSEYLDFALIRLDRPVANAVPIKMAKGLPERNQSVMTIGNPSGLPQKIADGAWVKSKGKFEFRANLDTFNYGSGSPVFDQKTGEYLGVLSRGADDFVQHKTKSCLVANRIGDSEPGEIISSIVQFKKILGRR